MARGRFISRNMPQDFQINRLSSDTCRLAFTFLIVMADCEGRESGDPDLLVSKLFPRRKDVTSSLMESFIREWVMAGFVVWYQGSDGDRYLQLLNFSKHQIGLRKDREVPSMIPEPRISVLIEGGYIPGETDVLVQGIEGLSDEALSEQDPKNLIVEQGNGNEVLPETTISQESMQERADAYAQLQSQVGDRLKTSFRKRDVRDNDYLRPEAWRTDFRGTILSLSP